MADWLEKVKAARDEGSFEKTMALLQTELTSRPNDSQVHYQIAWRLFSDHRPFQVFAALTKFNLGKFEDAMGILIKQLAETSSDPEIQSYRRALLFYADKLKETFE